MQQVFNTSGTVNLENHHGHQESDDSTNKTDNADGDIYTGEEFSQDKEVEEELKHFNSNQFDGNINFFLHQDSRSNSSSPSRPTNDDKKHNDNLDDLNDKIDNYPKNYIIPLGLRKPFIVPFATARIKTKTTEPNSIPVITPKNKQAKVFHPLPCLYQHWLIAECSNVARKKVRIFFSKYTSLYKYKRVTTFGRHTRIKVVKQIQQARATIKNIQKRHIELRSKHLEELAARNSQGIKQTEIQRD